jgi:hypothetical protein
LKEDIDVGYPHLFRNEIEDMFKLIKEEKNFHIRNNKVTEDLKWSWEWSFVVVQLNQIGNK